MVLYRDLSGNNPGSTIELTDSYDALTTTGMAAVLRSTSTHASISSGAASVTLMAANPNRKGGSITNTDANPLYIDLNGGTATITGRFHKKLLTDETYEIPFGITGAITGIWSVDGAGTANVMESA